MATRKERDNAQEKGEGSIGGGKRIKVARRGREGDMDNAHACPNAGHRAILSPPLVNAHRLAERERENGQCPKGRGGRIIARACHYQATLVTM